MKPAEIDYIYKELLLEVGEKIKDLRKTRSISYTQISKEIGISRNGYNNIELGKSNFQIMTLLRILSYHNISIFDFFESIKR
ncbi:MAG: helix-turn-helix transcriptional regulator [Bacteroidales bacterium]|jgi:transcriptional regulator with XRE-family HTH domain